MVQLQVVGEDPVADEIGDEREDGGHDYRGHGCETVQPVCQVDGVAAADEDEHAEQRKQETELQQGALEHRDGQAGAERAAGQMRDPGRRQQSYR